MNSKIKELTKQGGKLFSDRSTLESFWQEIADNFYPQRADFTRQRTLGEDFAQNLTTSYPILAHRDLSNAISTYLRPRSQKWFKMSIADEDKLDNEGKEWLEWATERQRKFVYEKNSGFVRATKEADADFAAFGQAAIYVESDFKNMSLVHHCCHLRDIAWCEDETGKISNVYRKKKWTAQQLKSLFGDKIHENVSKLLSKEPYKEVNCYHVVLKSENYSGEKKYKQPYISFWIDCDNDHVMEEVGSWTFKYIIPRWQTVSGSQYAIAPCVAAALPDARLIQSTSLTLLEAGEKAVNPPLVAVQDVFRADSISTASAAINWMDSAYDERTGAPIRELFNVDKSALSFGINLREETKMMIMEAFYLNKLTLPINNGQMTATEVTQRIQEYIRNALPLFEPMETEYNAALCELQFETLFRAGAFNAKPIPDSLAGQDIKFIFENPLIQAEGKEKLQKLLEAKAALAEAAALDPSVINIVDIKTAFRDALNGNGTPAKWLRDEKVVQQIDDENKQKQEAQEMIAALGQGAQVAEQVGKAGVAVQQAGII
jgi:hypothetical protein